jgi:hypothetical protein
MLVTLLLTALLVQSKPSHHKAAPHSVQRKPRIKPRIFSAGLKHLSDGLVPIHDIFVQTNDSGTGKISGYFYLGGQYYVDGYWDEPKMFVEDRAPDFKPGSKWKSVGDVTFAPSADPCSSQGSFVHFDAKLPSGMDQFSLAIQMRGISFEGIDEISFVVGAYDPLPYVSDRDRWISRKGNLRPTNNRTNNVVPISIMRPYVFADRPEIHYVYTNSENFDIQSKHLFFLNANKPDPDVSMNWDDLHHHDAGAAVDSLGATERRHKLHFKKGAGVKHYMVADIHGSSANETDQHSEWSGIIRTPGNPDGD